MDFWQDKEFAYFDFRQIWEEYIEEFDISIYNIIEHIF